MTNPTLPIVTIFDQHDLELIARRQLQFIMTRAAQQDINVMLRVGRKLIEKEPLDQNDRVQLYALMMGLRLDGIITIPARLMNHVTGRVQTYEHICRELYKQVTAPAPTNGTTDSEVV